eukprot:2427866-Pleurochrysis_carterae.AAC.1
MAMFIARGYAAAAAARPLPRSSLPCARCWCPSSPCAHCAAASFSMCGRASAVYAIVVNLRVSVPSAHCASVNRPAPVVDSARCIRGSSQSGA